MTTPAFSPSFLRQVPLEQAFQPGRMALPQAVQFGWRNHVDDSPKPQDYQRNVTLADLQQPLDLDNPQPSLALVRQVMDKLHGLENPRFVMLTGLKTLLKTPERVRRFQENILKALYQTARSEAPDLVPGASHQLLCQLIKGYGPTTQMHWDFKQWPILSLSYEQSARLKGFNPLLADSAQLFADLRQSSEGLGFINSIPDSPDKPDVMLKPHRQRMESDYRIAVPLPSDDDIPILILNNQRWTGIMHGTQRPESRDLERRDAFKNDRTLYQIAISDVSFPAQKYAMLQFDQHKREDLAETSATVTGTNLPTPPLDFRGWAIGKTLQKPTVAL